MKGCSIMPIDFFQKEVTKVQGRFNETFGETQVVNLSTRFNTIFSIINLGLIAKEIKKQSIKKNGKKDIEKVKEFMRTKGILNKVFDNFEKDLNQTSQQTSQQKKQQERRNDHANATKKSMSQM
jgi:hypothetical protein